MHPHRVFQGIRNLTPRPRFFGDPAARAIPQSSPRRIIRLRRGGDVPQFSLRRTIRLRRVGDIPRLSLRRIIKLRRGSDVPRLSLRRIRVLPRFWRFVSLLLILIFGACALSSELKYRRCCAHLAQVQDARDEAAQRVEALSQRLNAVQTDAYIEEIARRELNLLYPGEIRYVAR